MPSITLQALQAAEKSLNDLLNGGFTGNGLIPVHFRTTRASTEASLSLVRLAIQGEQIAAAKAAHPIPAEMTTPALLEHIEQLQAIQKTHSPKTQAWQTAHELIMPCFEEMNRREPYKAQE